MWWLSEEADVLDSCELAVADGFRRDSIFVVICDVNKCK